MPRRIRRGYDIQKGITTKQYTLPKTLPINFQKVFDDAMKVKNKMDAATALINGLAGERVRWTDQLAQFKAETERLVGDIVLLTGFLGYTGPFNQEFRMTMQQSWLDSLVKRKIPVTLSLNIIDSLSDTATVKKLSQIWKLLVIRQSLFDRRLESGIFKVCRLMICQFKMA